MLDIDGVLKTPAYDIALGNGTNALTPLSVGLLNTMCEETPDYRLAFCSAWRAEEKEIIIKHLEEALQTLEKSSGMLVTRHIKFFDIDEHSWRLPLTDIMYNGSDGAK